MQIDIDEKKIGNRYPVEVGLAGDAASALEALNQRLEHRPRTQWTSEVEAEVSRWRILAADRAAVPASPVNPERVVRELNGLLPGNAQLSVDVGSCVYWYARQLVLPEGVPAHLSGTLASMGCSIPYGLAAKLAHPDRPLVALTGDGAMQMLGVAELVTVAHRWRQWQDPRFVVCVFNNRELTEVTWEQRESEAEPRFAASQELPDFPFAGYADLLGLKGIRVEDPELIADAWEQAFAADCPVVIEVLSDPEVPLLPPFPAGRQKAESMRKGLAAEDDGGRASALLDTYVSHEERPEG